MRYAIIALAAAVTAVTAQDDCQAEYTKCIAAGTPEVKCSCDLTTCSGEDAARIREYCATATANLPSGTATSSASVITGTAGSQPSGQPPITAPAGSLGLGETCSDDRQCKDGVQCWGSNAMIIRACGNFNAACSSDSQCAFNTCNNGLCNGFKATSASASATGSVMTAGSGAIPTCNDTPGGPAGACAAPSSTTYACNPAHQYPAGQVCTEINGSLTLVTASASATAAATYACNPAHAYPNGAQCISTAGSLTLVTPSASATGYHPGSGNATATGTGAMQPTGSLTPYTGSASVASTLSGLAAMVAGVVAYLL